MSIAPRDIKLDSNELPTTQADTLRQGGKRAKIRRFLRKITRDIPARTPSKELTAPKTPMTVATAMPDAELLNEQEPEITEQKRKAADNERETTDEYVPVTMESLQTTEPATIALGLIFGYVTLGVSFYSYVTEWSPLEAFYFVVVTLTSVGYGDLVPAGDDVRLFTAFYILLGVGILGTALGEVVSSLLNVDATPAGRIVKWLSGGGQQKEEQAGGGDANQSGENQSEIEQLTGGESAQETLVKTLSSVGTCLAVGSVAFYCLEPGITPAQAFYNAVVTSTTVGYGDLTPTTPQAQAFVCVYALFGTVLLARALGALANIPLEKRRLYQQQLVLEQYGGELDAEELDDLQTTLAELELCDADRGYCTRSDFALAMLVRQDKVTRRDVQAALGTFAKLDIDGSGELDEDDVKAWLEKQRAEQEEA